MSTDSSRWRTTQSVMETEFYTHAEAKRQATAPISSEEEKISFYISKLSDRSYVKTYGGEEHHRTWYTAAEALGEIGKPAIPALLRRLDTPDPYELMLVVYAMMLASQDTKLKAETGDDYLRLDTLLTPETNADNRRRAHQWWKRYRHLWRSNEAESS